jgi:hypothetical protein
MFETKEGPPDVRAVQGCPLPTEIGQKKRSCRRAKLAQIGCQMGGVGPRNAGKPVQRVRRGKDHAHLVPRTREGVTEGVHRGRGIGAVAVVRREKHP